MDLKDMLDGLKAGTLEIKGPVKPDTTEVSENIWVKVSSLRNDYTSCLKLARETDSKKEDAYLRLEAAKALEELRKICPHKHCVCLASEYEGSYSMDYDNSHKEHRICLCCGLEEYAWNPDWKELKTKPFSRFENKYPDQIKNPMKYLLSDATEIAETQGYHYFGNRRF